ncbi:hypothetical protein E2C01_047383 [Portunus trituberculatus]|uniref:Uncharacterized protein n=1 Tax=Portunus trituberculatus TaxID=210409 RepID=A0A5B7G7B0_PORTR|nr:hypothetical protein [Portunus trituberculatus]
MESLIFPAFSPEPTYTAATRWEVWLKRFDSFVTAQDVTEDRSNPGAISRRQYSTRPIQDRYRCGGCGRVHSVKAPETSRGQFSARFIDQDYDNDEDYGTSSQEIGRHSQVHEMQRTLNEDYSWEDVLPLHIRRPDEGEIPVPGQRGAELPSPPYQVTQSLRLPETDVPTVPTVDLSVLAQVIPTAAGRDAVTPATTKTSHPSAEHKDNHRSPKRSSVQLGGNSSPQPNEVTVPEVTEYQGKPPLRRSTRNRKAPDRLGLSNATFQM